MDDKEKSKINFDLCSLPPLRSSNDWAKIVQGGVCI